MNAQKNALSAAELLYSIASDTNADQSEVQDAFKLLRDYIMDNSVPWPHGRQKKGVEDSVPRTD